MNRFRSLFLSLLGSAILLNAEHKPDVLLIMSDDMGYSDLGCFGGEIRTPHLDALGQSGIRFSNFYSENMCWVSRASLLTGVYHRTSLKDGTLHPRCATLPEALRKAGYATLMAGKWHLAGKAGKTVYPNDRGFDRFVCLDDGTADVVAQELEKWREEVASSDQPYFLYLHLMDAHMPYHAREPLYKAHEDETDDARSRYDSEILFMDGWLEKIFTRWGWGPETLLVALSDHGEEFGEHGEIGHRHSLHVELNRILLMFRGPGIRSGEIPYLGGINDVLPTLLDLANLPPPDEGTGLSLGPLLRGIASRDEELEFRDRTLFAHRAKFRPKTSHLWAANYKGFRMIQDVGVDLFFDLVRDPFEELNRVSMLPILSQDVRVKLWDFRRMGFGNRSTPIEIELDPDTLSLLDALGYVDTEEEAEDGEPRLDGPPEGP